MTKAQHKRTAEASMFQNGISHNTKCAEMDSFHRDSHIFMPSIYYMILHPNLKKIGSVFCKIFVPKN